MSESFLNAAVSRAADAAPDVLTLCCARCQTVIASAGELLCDPTAFSSESVWAYELDMLDQTAFVYSATNPTAERFDVARLSSCARLHFDGAPVAEHSWFPPHRWINAGCPGCRAQLGWVFVAASDVDGRTPPPAFAGVILTRLREAAVRPERLAIPDPGATRVPTAGRSSLMDFLAEGDSDDDPRSRRVRILDHLVEAGAGSEALLDMWRSGWQDDPQNAQREPHELVAELRAQWVRSDDLSVAMDAMAALGDRLGDQDAIDAVVNGLTAEQAAVLREHLAAANLLDERGFPNAHASFEEAGLDGEQGWEPLRQLLRGGRPTQSSEPAASDPPAQPEAS